MPCSGSSYHYTMINDDVDRRMHYRTLLRTSFASGDPLCVREVRILCLVAETVFGVWLQFLARDSAARQPEYTALCPWDITTLPYRGLNCSIPIKQMFTDPMNELAAITPEDRQWHKAEREAIYRHTVGDEAYEGQLAAKRRDHSNLGRERKEELRARDWLRRNGVVLPARPKETIQGPMGRRQIANRTFYRDLLGDWNAGRWGLPNLLPNGLTAQVKSYPHITCDSCGTNDHDWYWCILRRRNASEDAKYRGEKVVEGDEVLTLAEVPEVQRANMQIAHYRRPISRWNL